MTMSINTSYITKRKRVPLEAAPFLPAGGLTEAFWILHVFQYTTLSFGISCTKASYGISTKLGKSNSKGLSYPVKLFL